MFLRDLPEPLLTYEAYPSFIAVPSMSVCVCVCVCVYLVCFLISLQFFHWFAYAVVNSERPAETQISDLHNIVSQLPAENLCSIIPLFRFLHNVTLRKEVENTTLLLLWLNCCVILLHFVYSVISITHTRARAQNIKLRYSHITLSLTLRST